MNSSSHLKRGSKAISGAESRGDAFAAVAHVSRAGHHRCAPPLIVPFRTCVRIDSCIVSSRKSFHGTYTISPSKAQLFCPASLHTLPISTWPRHRRTITVVLFSRDSSHTRDQLWDERVKSLEEPWEVLGGFGRICGRAGALAMAAVRDAALKMSMSALQRNVIPDVVLRWGVRRLLEGRLGEITRPTLEAQTQELLAFVQSLKQMPIAVHTEDANAQHYEVPTDFYQLVLGKRLKYSSAYFPKEDSSLDEAEEAMFALYAERAQLQDGQSVLDVGCGWGSLSMYIAEKYPNSKVTGVSNSETQKAFITQECSKRGLSNVTIISCDINVFISEDTFDRILSIEMFEHMKNYEKLLKKISSWLKPDGLLFVHIFVHKSIPYHFEDQGEDDWMSRNFFTGGTMPSSCLLLYFQDDVSIVNQWFVNGTHYSRTSEGWLLKMDAQIKVIRPIFAKTYGEAEVTKWVANWRTFFIAVAEMFAFRNGEEWGVGHYLFKKK